MSERGGVLTRRLPGSSRTNLVDTRHLSGTVHPLPSRRYPTPKSTEVPTKAFLRRSHLEGVTPKHVDVTSLVQRRVEEFGGGVIEFVAGKDDLNRLFGNPLPRQRKELRVPYLVTVRGYGKRDRCSAVGTRSVCTVEVL